MTDQMLFWLFGMWIIGGIVYTTFGMQIVITKRCALKIFDLLKEDAQNWYASACKKYWKKIILRNRLIITIITCLLFWFLPGIGFIGFLAGSFTKWLFTLSKTGLDENNINDSCAVFVRYIKPGKEEEFSDALGKALIHILDVEYDRQSHIIIKNCRKSISDFLHTPYGFATGFMIATIAFLAYLFFMNS